MNFATLLETLSAAPADLPLIFETSDGAIGAGYHVTEFKHAQITGIDCGARLSNWSEATLQLLDGAGRAHMRLSTFTNILRQSIAQVPGLGTAPIRVEFAPGNAGMRSYDMQAPDVSGDRAVIRLREARAICKPAHDKGGTCGTAVDQRTGATASTGCCA
tara:strand:+ start:1990 stop:2469 length:480 start_codon:yes stop_codon:yes gene_type:complete